MNVSTPIRRWWKFCVPVAVLTVLLARALAEAPPAPTLSTIVSAERLNAAIDEYLADLKPLLVDEATYTKSADQVGFKANAVTAVVHVLAKHDGASPYKANASETMAAGRELTRAKDYATAQAAWEKLQAAVAKTDAAAEAPTWDRVASLGRMMEETSTLNGKLKRNLKRLDRTKDDNLQAAAVLTAFGQLSIYDTHEVKNEADFDAWYAMMTEFRDASAALNKPLEAGDADAVKAGLDRLEKSCATCHEKFHNE